VARLGRQKRCSRARARRKRSATRPRRCTSTRATARRSG
jgi:hypothetical protein